MAEACFEVYPHPAHVVLFDLQRIIKYKKGTVAQRRAGLTQLRQAGLHHLGTAAPSLVRETAVLRQLVERPLETLPGEALKAYEDALDALLCAFTPLTTGRGARNETRSLARWWEDTS